MNTNTQASTVALAAALPDDHPDRPKLPPMTRRKAWNVEETRQLLGGISRKGIYDLIQSGDLPSIMIAGRRLIPDEGIDALIRLKLAAPMEHSARGQSRNAA